MAELLTEEGIQGSLAKVPGWERDGGSIRKKIRLKDFAAALEFVNRIGIAAEAMDHHPDILIHGYRYVTLTLCTHSAGGLTRMDFDLAQKIEEIGKGFSCSN
jgi:4a-hydroxytetrahydrobiopterin dehydratase